MQRLKEIASTIGIAVIFSAFILVLLSTIYSEPKYEDFCDIRPEVPRLLVQEKETICSGNIEADAQSCYDQKMEPIYTTNASGCQVVTECSDCRNQYDTAREAYGKIAFIVLAIIGAIAIAGGMLYKLEFVGTGFIISGVFLIFYASVRYFGELGKWTRVVILFIDLIVVLWVAINRVGKRTGGKEEKQ